MSQHRAVQLSPSTLALVLCKHDPSFCSSDQGGNRGTQIFQDFQAANVKCFWNRRLVRAVSDVSFQGWLENWVLLVQGQRLSLEVLRDAWARRALRAPRGFIIKAIGDVSPVHMNPVSQSQFIPLAEVICCAISDMNCAQIVVTQETLMEQLIKHYPGIATPSQDILYNTLGTLIKERKIYHTGEGYFIVTPQTYFITRKPPADEKGVTSEDNYNSPPSITYLVSMESCADLTKGNVPTVSHCRSCSCFSEHSVQNILGQQSINESHGKGHRTVKESKPSVQNQATSTAMDHQTCGTPKPHISLKEKEKCNKKFGISLFWRNTSKKEKPKKEQATFSAQFPPKEWPVRDEDNLDNIPRDIEHEIIKRINPILTIDNLMKHTVLMQKAEEQKKYFSKGTSTDILKNKHRHHFKGSNRKKHGKFSKYHRKGLSSKEKCTDKSKRDVCEQRSVIKVEKDVGSLLKHQINATDDPMVQDSFCPVNVEVIQPNNVYKKQIGNPFEGIPYRDNSNTNGHRALKVAEMKRSRSGKEGKGLSRSLDCSRTKPADNRAKYSNAGSPVDENNIGESFHDQIVPLSPDKDDLNGYPHNYPQCSTLRIDDKFKQVKESNSALGLFGEEGSHILGNIQSKPLLESETIREHEDYEGIQSLFKRTNGNKISSIHGTSQHTQVNHCKNVIVSKSIGRHHLGVPEKTETVKHSHYSASGLRDQDLPKYTTFNTSENEGLTDDDQTLYQKEVEDDDACSSLYLDEDDTDENIEICAMLQTHAQKTSVDTTDWRNTREENNSASEMSQDNWKPKTNFASQITCVSHDQESYSPSVLSVGSSQGYQKPSVHAKGCPNQQLSQYVHKRPEAEAGTAECLHSSEIVDGSIFDYCNSSDGNSVAETLQMLVHKNDEQHVRNMGQQSEEMRTCYEHKLKLFSSHDRGLSKSNPLETSHSEKNENHSTTGDSGIESPRTQISLASSNSVILDKMKRRSFLQTLESTSRHTKNEALLTAHSIMQLTPSMNV
ncbi:storkhead-box protein 1 [Ascaphus truei]|uniref:storkhead-box protein 1 n=1 Tax=Ascaphus truei TaxID=8439 RepID=UPI003F59C62B